MGESHRISSSSAASARIEGASPAMVEQWRATLRTALARDADLPELLDVCADSNAWTLDEATESPHHITFMELFLLQIPRLPVLKYFPNLTVIKLMNIGLRRMSDLAGLAHVEELWLCDNYISKIEGLEQMTRLRRLYLQGNDLTSLDGLPPLRHLRELWVCGNDIDEITHITPLSKLRTLYLSQNPIRSLRGAFSEELTRLTDVNLAGCHLSLLETFTELRTLPVLRRLWMADPLFGDNPVCRLHNYSTYALCALDALEVLDGNHITEEQRAMAQSVFHKKEIYYHTRIHTLEMHVASLARYAEDLAARRVAVVGEELGPLYALLHPIQGELAERQTYSVPFASQLPNGREVTNDQLEEVKQHLMRAVGTRQVEHQTIMRKLTEAMRLSASLQGQLKTRLAIELNTAGNIRLEKVSTREAAFRTAEEMVQSRFHGTAFARRFGITGVEVTGVSRIVNRGLRIRFDDRVKEMHVNLADPQQAQRFVCLFGVQPSSAAAQSKQFQDVYLHGRPRTEKGDEAGSEKAGGKDEVGSIPLTDSLYHTDEERLVHCQRTGEMSSIGASAQALAGRLLLYRVYLGKTVHAMGSVGGRASSGTASSAAAVMCGYMKEAAHIRRGDYGHGVTAAYRVLPAFTDGKVGGDVGSAETTMPSYHLWYCLDEALVLPDMVVEYRYTLANTAVSAGPAVKMSATLERLLKAKVTPSIPMPRHGRGDASQDLLYCASPLLDFIQWCEGEGSGDGNGTETSRSGSRGSTASSLQLVATKESEAAVESVRKLLKEETVGLLQQRTGASRRPSLLGTYEVKDGVLTNDLVQRYRATLGIDKEGVPFTYCSLQGCGLLSLRRDFTSASVSQLTVLDLSHNALTEVSWFAIAKEMPELRELNLSWNKVRHFELNGMMFPSLCVLNLMHNLLEEVDDFADVQRCMPRLTELFLAGNPLFSKTAKGEKPQAPSCGGGHSPLQREALLLFYFTSEWACRNSDGGAGDGNQSRPLSSSLGHHTVKKLDGLLTDSASGTSLLPLEWCERHALCLQLASGTASSASPLLRRYADLITHAEQNRAAELAVVSMTQGRTPFNIFNEALSTISLKKSASAGDSANNAEPSLQTFSLNDGLLQKADFVAALRQLRHLTLRHHRLTKVDFVTQLSQLRSLDVAHNELESLPSLTALSSSLVELNVSFNRLTRLSKEVGPLAQLRALNVSGNQLHSIDTSLLFDSPALEELYLSMNQLTDITVLYPLKDLPSLIVISVNGNLFQSTSGTTAASGARRSLSSSCMTTEEERLYLVHVLPHLKVLNGEVISNGEQQSAKEAYAGKMNTELLAERASGTPSKWGKLKELDLSSCGLREIRLLEAFESLEVLRLSRNALSCLRGMPPLKHLKALQLSMNRIGAAGSPVSVGSCLQSLPQLASLSLEANQISDVADLQLQLPNLEFLNLRGNEIEVISGGFAHLPALQELLLDQNKIRAFTANCFAACKNLREISAENNLIRASEGLRTCTRLEHLKLGANRLGELTALLTDIQRCPLVTAVFVGNTVSRKSNYRPSVIAQMPHLTSLDRREVTFEERGRAESARAAEMAPPPNVVIDMNFFAPVPPVTATGTGLSLGPVGRGGGGGGGGARGGGRAGQGGRAVSLPKPGTRVNGRLTKLR